MFEFHQSTILQKPLEEVFEFFASAENLEKITPPFVGFKIQTPLPIKMEEGTIIDYRIKIRGFPMKWQTLISEWCPPYQFVDEQVKGPYRTWIHTHSFKRIEDSEHTEMKDHVLFSMLGGKWVHFLVKRDIEKIFNFRTQIIESIFNKQSNHPMHYE